MAISNVYADNGDLSVAKKPGVSTVHVDNMPEGGGSGGVTSVNGQTGAVTLNASDVGALPSSTVIPSGEELVPAHSVSDNGKVLGVNSSGNTEWVTAGGGQTYTAGNMISISSNTIGVSTTAGITDIQVVNSLPASPVSTVLYLIPET